MPHDTPLISTIVAGLVLAFIFGAIANRIKMPPLVGYLIAGVCVGPYTPGFVANGELAGELSEIGVILLMFGVGLHFSLKDLLSVQAVAIPGALLRIIGGTAMGMGLAWMLGWPIGGGLIFGLALSVASTVVLLKALQDRHLVESDRGRIAVGWVIVEDIAMVLALVLIPAFAGVLGGTEAAVHDPFVDLTERLVGFDLGIWGVLAVTVVKLAAFVGFMFVVGRRVIPWILHLTAHTGSRELFRLAVLAIALGVAAGAASLFGVSLALGAFFAGMILSESELSNRAAQESLPFRDAFAVLFFVSVGMLFNPTILITHPLEVLGTLFIILVGKSVIGFVVVVALGRPVSAALTISAALAQIGEFSFILAALGIGLGLMPADGQSYILAGAILSIIINPILMFLAEHARPHLEAPAETGRVEPALAPNVAPMPAAVQPVDERRPTALADHAVLIGYGRVGTIVAEGLSRQHMPFVVIEDSEARVAAARAAGVEVVVGNAASREALALANVKAAHTLFVAIPNAFEAGQAVEQAHKLNPNLQIIARAHADEEVAYLRDLGATQVIMGEREIGLGMLEWMTPAAASPAGESVPVATPMHVATVTPTPMGGGFPLPEAAPAMETPMPIVVEAAPAAVIPSDPRPGPLPPPGPGPTPLPEPPPAPPPRPKPPPRVRPLAPATTAATPFNPEVVPSDE